MRIYISADIEGVAGVVSPAQCTAGHPEYERARRLMTEEVNAAIAGAFSGGATEVLVNDAHGMHQNLLPDLLDPRAELIQGKPKPLSMMAGLTAAHDGVLLVGWHAGARRGGVLAHTTSGVAFAAIRLNGHECAEATLYGAYAGSLGVRILMLSGDDVLAEECGPLFSGATRIVVKTALGNRAARALSPATAGERIRAGAEAAVRHREQASPFLIAPPYRLEIETMSAALADLAAIVPGLTRVGPVTVACDPEDMTAVLGWVNTVSALSAFFR